MPISRYNHEGYPDPTAYEALTAVDRQQRQERYRPVVCIIAPEGADDTRYLHAHDMMPLCTVPISSWIPVGQKANLTGMLPTPVSVRPYVGLCIAISM